MCIVEIVEYLNPLGLTTIAVAGAGFLMKTWTSFSLEKSKIEFQTKFSKLYGDRAEVIKNLYQSFYELEKRLTNYTTFNQGPEVKTDNNRYELVVEKYNELVDLIETNRIYFTNNFCKLLLKLLNESKSIIDKMKRVPSLCKYEDSGGVRKEGESANDVWREAEKETKKIKIQRLDLAERFRKLIGIEENF